MSRYESPVGQLRLVGSDAGLRALLWPADADRVDLPPIEPDGASVVLIETARQLDQYFAGSMTGFDLPLDPVGTAFQRAVWDELTRIPPGETRSYQQVASAIGKPTAARAVGAANGRNPISIVVPCHRVVGSSGALTGFAGGLHVKRFLLDHEAAIGRS